MALDKIKYAIGADTLSKSGGHYIVRKQYFYRMGNSEENLKNNVLKVFPNAKIVEIGDHYASFRGGASVAASSHFWVKFDVTIEEIKQYMRTH
jgi:hypothetical protein